MSFCSASTFSADSKNAVSFLTWFLYSTVKPTAFFSHFHYIEITIIDLFLVSNYSEDLSH